MSLLGIGAEDKFMLTYLRLLHGYFNNEGLDTAYTDYPGTQLSSFSHTPDEDSQLVMLFGAGHVVTQTDATRWGQLFITDTVNTSTPLSSAYGHTDNNNDDPEERTCAISGYVVDLTADTEYDFDLRIRNSTASSITFNSVFWIVGIAKI